MEMNMKKILEESEVLKTSSIKKYAEKETIASEGDPEVGWYILIKGKVGVFKHDKKIAEFDKGGMVFGELSSILNTPRTASLVALEPTKVVHFKATIDHLIKRYPEMTKNIMVNLAERLTTTTDNMIALTENGPGQKL
jgi:CRP/FNR family transcriptional regulator, cyclic AMP receptor protein